MDSSQRSGTFRMGLRRIGAATLTWAWTASALAHPGHDHDSPLAAWAHLFDSWGHWLALLAAGSALAMVVTSRMK